MLTNELFEIPKRRHASEINIVPILDMLVTIIFFLLLSTSFLQFNKLTVPPSRTSVITSPERPPPLQARMLLAETTPGELRLILHWAGDQPGAYSENFSTRGDGAQMNDAIALKVTEFASKFKTRFVTERTIQVGLGKKMTISHLVLLMDTLRPHLPDIVLVSAQDAQVEAEKYAGAKP